MKQYNTAQIRNIGLFSHGGAGKTSLLEAMLFTSKAITRLGASMKVIRYLTTIPMRSSATFLSSLRLLP